MEDLQNSKEGLFNDINTDGLEVCFEGDKQLIVIGISNQNKDENNTTEVINAAYDLNHEEGAHGIDIVDDGENNSSSSEDHAKYYGTGTGQYSPEDSEVKENPEYSGSPAQINYQQIDDEIKN